MATVHADDSEEGVRVQFEETDDKMRKAHIFAGVLAVAVAAVLVYAVVKNINKDNK